MKNKFKEGELVIVNRKLDKNISFKDFAIIKCKEYDFNEYLTMLLLENKEEWFKEKNIKPVLERKNKKMEKFKVVMVIDKKGLDIINNKLKQMPDPKNNVFKNIDIYKEYKVNRKTYVILVWSNTYWPLSNYSVNCVQELLDNFRKLNIAYQEIIVGLTDKTYVKIKKFDENDSNINILELELNIKVKLKNSGGIII